MKGLSVYINTDRDFYPNKFRTDNKTVKPGKYTEEFKAQCVARIKDYDSMNQAAMAMGVENTTLTNWAIKAGVYKIKGRNYPEHLKRQAVEVCSRLGIQKASLELNIAKPTLRAWFETISL